MNGKEIHVLMIGNDPSVKGGITSVIQQLLRYSWDSKGIRMDFIPTYVNDGRAHRLTFFLGAYHKIKKIFQTDRPDIVHIHMSYKGSFVRKHVIHQLCKKYGLQDIFHLHGSEFKKWYDSIDMKEKKKVSTMLDETSAVIVLGNEWEKVIQQIAPKANVVVLPNSVAIPSQAVQWNDDHFQYLFMGVLIKRKGVQDLISAVKKIEHECRERKLHFVIAGTGPDEQMLKDKAKAEQVDDLITFYGWVNGEDKEKLYMDCQAMILPSYNEGLPISILEALSYGMPVIATDVGDVNSAVRNDFNGALIQPGVIDEIAEAILKISDRDQFDEMKKNSRELAEKDFSEEKYMQKLLQLYQNTVIV